MVSFAGGAYYLLFTPHGNDILKPFIKDYISSRSGGYDVVLKNYKLTPSKIDANLTIDSKYDANIHGDINLLSQKFDLKYTLFSDNKEDLLNGTLKTEEASLKKIVTNYTLNIPNLSKLEPIIGYRLRGDLETKGIAELGKETKIGGFCKSFGGDIDYILKNSKLDVKISSIPLTNIFYTLITPEIFKGMLFGDVTYDLTTQKGKLDAKIETLKILPNQVTDILKNYVNINFTKERYNQTIFKANMDNNLVTFDFDAKSKNSHIHVKDGLIEKNENLIDSKFYIMIDGKDFSGTIKGNLQKPDVKLDSSQYLEQTISKKVNDFIDGMISDKTKKTITDTLKEIGLGDTNNSLNIEDTVKGLLKEFF
jgi:hypothetical protein